MGVFRQVKGGLRQVKGRGIIGKLRGVLGKKERVLAKSRGGCSRRIYFTFVRQVIFFRQVTIFKTS